MTNGPFADAGIAAVGDAAECPQVAARIGQLHAIGRDELAVEFIQAGLGLVDQQSAQPTITRMRQLKAKLTRACSSVRTVLPMISNARINCFCDSGTAPAG